MIFFNTDEIGGLLDTAINVRVYFFEKKRGGHNIYLFPNDATMETLSHYKSLYEWITNGKELTEYSLTDAPKETIQKIMVDELHLWQSIVDLISSVPVTNAPIFTPEIISDKIKFIVAEVTLSSENEEKKVYLIQRFNFKKAVYGKMRFFFLESNFQKLTDDTITFGESIDCFVWDNNAYIINETAFNTLFDFHKRIEDEVQKNIVDVESWTFFDDNSKIADLIAHKPRKGLQFNKVATSHNLIVWKSKTASERKLTIESNVKLKDKFQFDDSDKIIITKESLNEFFKLMCDDYFNQIITGETAER